MKHLTLLTAAAAALTTNACSKPVDASADAATSQATPIALASAPSPSISAGTAPASFTKGQPPSKAFMVGSWGMGEGCDLPINFQRDGTIKDGPFNRWNLENGTLSMEGAPQKMKLEVVDEKTMLSQLDGSARQRTLTRC